jgi:hypothetical protein
MNFPLKIPASKAQSCVYASFIVWDGGRKLKPTHIAFDWLYFIEPPQISSSEIEIVLINGDAEYRYIASVLPHDLNSTDIPIQLAPVA